ncbi:MAG TPA: inorganic diphosphatase [Saprospiraceae bacterium]|nr:inorganic diphosphatase [Saprospiraceae bacterium]HMX89347.1 inorganic diphosphatase [Saprospiraceae bacterium]HMZ41312.1 inorganic diphosphatase [Saprospiraceae bacterium]HNA65970.1 inorganic diphosphatase [Saprospiraceae bacterium]HNC37598.1 inorganic diphosphatase [Saprospiraceae bacterium]
MPQGSRIKYEVDKASGLIRMDRLLASSFEYPINYGFIPRTLGPDGDPLDILVITHSPVVPLTLITCRVIGIMAMTDCGIADDKIIAVAERDVSVEHIRLIQDLPLHWKEELKNFFEEYTKLENKKVMIGDFSGADVAARIIQQHIDHYQKEYGQ